MIRTLSRGLAALVLALFAEGYVSERAMAEDERPDLKIELVGLPLSGSQREVKIKITNVSKWWSDETKLTVETTPAAAGPARTEKVENLDPGQSVTFSYTLAAACPAPSATLFAVSPAAVKIVANVTPGKNYAGVLESDKLLENNAVEGMPCVPPASAPGNILFGDYASPAPPSGSEKRRRCACGHIAPTVFRGGPVHAQAGPGRR